MNDGFVPPLVGWRWSWSRGSWERCGGPLLRSASWRSAAGRVFSWNGSGPGDTWWPGSSLPGRAWSLRAAGSARMLPRGTWGSCSAITSLSRPLVITHTLLASATDSRRPRVCWIMVQSPSSANTCLARARRLLGQNRVPLPPARITGANCAPNLLLSAFITIHGRQTPQRSNWQQSIQLPPK